VFKENLCGRGKDGACEQLYRAYGNKPPNCRLGRLDSTSADAEGLIPIPGAPASEYKVRDSYAACLRDTELALRLGVLQRRAA